MRVVEGRFFGSGEVRVYGLLYEGWCQGIHLVLKYFLWCGLRLTSKH